MTKNIVVGGSCKRAKIKGDFIYIYIYIYNNLKNFICLPFKKKKKIGNTFCFFYANCKDKIWLLSPKG